MIVPANYNSPGQLVISGNEEAVKEACTKLKEAGAKRALPLAVGGAFHSPLMGPARVELAKSIHAASVSQPVCPVYQNPNSLLLYRPRGNQRQPSEAAHLPRLLDVEREAHAHRRHDRV